VTKQPQWGLERLNIEVSTSHTDAHTHTR